MQNNFDGRWVARKSSLSMSDDSSSHSTASSQAADETLAMDIWDEVIGKGKKHKAVGYGCFAPMRNQRTPEGGRSLMQTMQAQVHGEGTSRPVHLTPEMIALIQQMSQSQVQEALAQRQTQEQERESHYKSLEQNQAIMQEQLRQQNLMIQQLMQTGVLNRQPNANTSSQATTSRTTPTSIPTRTTPTPIPTPHLDDNDDRPYPIYEDEGEEDD